MASVEAVTDSGILGVAKPDPAMFLATADALGLPPQQVCHVGDGGYYDAEGEFVYAGHTGTGFDADSLADMYRRLKKLERKTPPFREKPKTNEKPHWTTPRVVAQIKFNEWTRDGKLRQPVFLGFNDWRCTVKPGKLYFTSGATEAANWALKGAAARLPEGRRRIVTQATEHACVLAGGRFAGSRVSVLDGGERRPISA